MNGEVNIWVKRSVFKAVHIMVATQTSGGITLALPTPCLVGMQKMLLGMSLDVKDFQDSARNRCGITVAVSSWNTSHSLPDHAHLVNTWHNIIQGVLEANGSPEKAEWGKATCFSCFNAKYAHIPQTVAEHITRRALECW